jgi:hypothetical protein
MRYRLTIIHHVSGSAETVVIAAADVATKLAELVESQDVDEIHVVREPNPCAWKLGMSGGMGA